MNLRERLALEIKPQTDSNQLAGRSIAIFYGKSLPETWRNFFPKFRQLLISFKRCISQSRRHPGYSPQYELFRWDKWGYALCDPEIFFAPWSHLQEILVFSKHGLVFFETPWRRRTRCPAQRTVTWHWPGLISVPDRPVHLCFKPRLAGHCVYCLNNLCQKFTHFQEYHQRSRFGS